jgi:(2Fe-2S) ferredoxin
MVTVEEVECLAACDGAPVVQVNYENYERLSPEDAVHLVEALLQDEVPPPTFSADGSVTEPNSRGTYWRLAGLGDPPPSMGGPEPVAVADAPTAFPHQPPGPTVKDDPTTRPIEELRTGVDHGGTLTPEPILADRSTAHVPLTDEEKSKAQGEEPESEAGRAVSGATPAETAEATPAGSAKDAATGDAKPAPAKGRRQRRRKGAPAGASEGGEDAAAKTEAQAPEPGRRKRPAGRQPSDVAEEAGPNQREAPGGDPQ